MNIKLYKMIILYLKMDAQKVHGLMLKFQDNSLVESGLDLSYCVPDLSLNLYFMLLHHG